MLKKNHLAFLLLSLAVLSWSGNLIFGRYLHESIPPFGISLWRWGIALSILLIINARSLIPFFHMLKTHFYKLFLLSLFSIVLCSSFQYVGLKYTTATNAGIILSTMPIFITLCAEVILKEKTQILQKIGMGLAFFGALFLITQGEISRALHFDFNFGDLILLMTSFMWGVYTSLLKKFKLPCTSWELVQATSLISVCLIAIILFSQGKTEVVATFNHLNSSTLAAFFYMGIFASLLGLWGWNRGVQILGPTDAGIFMYLTPVFSGLLATLFLGEKIHLYHFMGALVICAGLFLTLKGGKRINSN